MNINEEYVQQIHITKQKLKHKPSYPLAILLGSFPVVCNWISDIADPSSSSFPPFKIGILIDIASSPPVTLMFSLMFPMFDSSLTINLKTKT